MRKILAGLLLLLPAGAGESLAQSVTAIAGVSATASPSIVSLGTSEPAVEARPVNRSGGGEVFAVSKSVVAYGAEAIAPARAEKVSALPDAAQAETGTAAPELQPEPARPTWRAEAIPLVIRGGVVGDAFSAPSAPPVALPEPAARSAPRREPAEAAQPPAEATRPAAAPTQSPL